ncbi:MAG: hypothetical protein HY520_03850, partial [Candidatus Aenigmarchaeota archaeon]|nr:hypothetical protein [Candidatus Aenigmarchaeota archaeon]
MNKTLLAMAIVLVILPAPALASLEIIGFTCNNMAPTANIETGTSMNCEATIQNTDSQNAASMTSA